MKTLQLFDSSQKRKLPFVPIQEGKVTFYVCGPTVYDHAHLGHARSSIAFDLWRRLFLALGYEVSFAKNFTDIDDKIIKKYQDTQKSLEEITQYYIQSYLEDMSAINVLPADIQPKATQNLDEMHALITTLLESQHAYQTSNGDIYLDSTKDSLYGTLSHRGEDLETRSRIQDEEGKKSHRDFVLWKAYKGEHDIGYASPFGKGRPGWHIECSAMIEKHLAYQNGDYAIDIHAGGADLLFPHHENEASQTRCATKRELAKYWIHNGFVTINGEKMSKSLGNSFFLKDVLKHYHGEIVRNYLLGTHYRANFDFSEEDLLASKKRLDKLYRLKKRLNSIQSSKAMTQFSQNLLEALSDDLNISLALSVIEQMIKESNESLDQYPKDKELKAQICANLELISHLLGIGEMDAIEYFQLGLSPEQKLYIQEQIALRLQAKKAKDYNLADLIRKKLEEEGIALLDTSEGTIWEKI
ncbi:cysteine--tRNA ligase [Helicobacter pametensis]|uniref:cysteine--tRNA ligase n=1 Tax=Helicobacter pametensis TaxID=95149 RepID=UPI00047F4631|nr:cysteine--tRNA ligase [Helicobacter pametensis]